MLSKLSWCLWQLLPCTYRTYYGDAAGRLHFTVWKMWFGCCYNSDDVTVDVVRHRKQKPAEDVTVCVDDEPDCTIDEACGN